MQKDKAKLNPLARLALLTVGVLATYSGCHADEVEPARLVTPSKIAVDKDGNVYIADTNNSTVDKLGPDGTLTILAGSPGIPGAAKGMGGKARLFGPKGIAIRGDGTLFVADENNNVIYKIKVDGAVSIFAGPLSAATLTETAAGINSGQISTREYADGSGTNARFYSPEGIAIDSAGNIYVADLMNKVIRKVSPSGKVTTLAGKPGEAGSMDGKGAAARFNSPVGIAVDKSGNVYVTDLMSSTIRKITPEGYVSTLAGEPGAHGTTDGRGRAARFMALPDIAIDRTGNLYVVDSIAHNIRKITPTGEVTTVAGRGSKLSTVDLALPTGIAVDGAGNIYVSDNGLARITKISPAGGVTTVIGVPK